jgi:hypothetical protein
MGMNSRVLLVPVLFLWACSDGSEGLSSANPPFAPQSQQNPPPAPDPPSEPAGPAAAVVILEKGQLNWPLGTWVDGASSGFVQTPTAAEDGAVRFSFAMEAQHAEIFTHSHFDLTRGHEAILLRAKASQPLVALVGMAALDKNADYWADLAAGHPWHVAEVPLQTDWADLNIPISTMQPRGPGVPQPFGASAPGVTLFAFMFANPGATDVWFEHIEVH